MTRIVCLHGFLGAPAAFAPVRAVLAAGEDVTSPPLPGHAGARPVDGGFRGAVDDVVSRAGTAPAIWVGYSMGGRIALGVLDAHPASVKALVLVSADAGIDDVAARAERAALDERRAAAVTARGLPAFVEDWEREPIFASQSAAQVAAQRSMRTMHDVRGIAWALRALGPASMPRFGHLLARPSVPIVYLAGARDVRYAERARALAEAGRVVVRVVPDVGHNLLVEAPLEVARAIDEIGARVTRTHVQAIETIVGEES